MDIGRHKRVIFVEPLEVPEEIQIPAEPEPAEVPEPVKEPASR